MKIKIIKVPEVIMQAENKEQNYFAWPTVERLKNGKIAVSCSGFRLEHICPFGKAVVSFSDDEGETFTEPEVIIDTVLDDRDAGLCAFGESGLIVTSFNNSVEFQRNNCCEEKRSQCLAYLDTVSAEEEKKALGSEFRISLDNGKSFGQIFKSPVTSPHGPVELKNGRILWVGNNFLPDRNHYPVELYEIYKDGSNKYIGEIKKDIPGVYMCEPYLEQLDDGTLVCHIRAEESDKCFTVYQAFSYDEGKTWTEPVPVLPVKGGAPAHIIRHSSGAVISVYGYREKPYGIRAMISTDNCKTWKKDFILYEQTVSDDIGYPATVELNDGSLMTVFYAHPASDKPAEILSVKWKIE